ncbi:MAG TPA: efflux RND transporter periplasmic adaptor subunit [Xenococcaceae cyanobacterium]
MPLPPNSSNQTSEAYSDLSNSINDKNPDPLEPENNSLKMLNNSSTAESEPNATDSKQQITLSSAKSLDRQKPKNQSEANNADNADKSGLKKYWWIALIGVVLAGGVAVWRPWTNNNNTEETATTSETTRLSVRTTKAQREPIRAWVSSEGRVQAVEYQHLTFEVEGDVTYIADRNGRRLREGDRVTAGELLARVDDRELVADVSQAEAAIAEARQNRAAAAAQVAQAQAQVAQARSQVQQAQAQVAQAQTSRNLAQTELERYRLLVQQGAISESEFDSRVSTAQDAAAQVTAVEAEVAAAREQVRSAQAQVQAAQEQYEATRSAITTAEARLEQAEVALEGASIYAPFDGIVAYLNYTEGEYFNPQIVTSQLGGDYQGILERIPMVIIDPSQYEVIVDLAGATGERVDIGQPALIASEGEIQSLNNSANTTFASPTVDNASETLVDNAQARGEVFAVNPAISPGGRAIEATVRLFPETTSNIRHGERVLTWIAVEEDSNAIVVPLNAVVYRDQTPYVFVVNQENVIEQRQVELGIRGITQQQIISGVKVEESVVTQGQNRLVDGAPVRIVN